MRGVPDIQSLELELGLVPVCVVDKGCSAKKFYFGRSCSPNISNGIMYMGPETKTSAKT